MIGTMQIFKYQQIKTNAFMIFAITTTHGRNIQHCMTKFIIKTKNIYICTVNDTSEPYTKNTYTQHTVNRFYSINVLCCGVFFILKKALLLTPCLSCQTR